VGAVLEGGLGLETQPFQAPNCLPSGARAPARLATMTYGGADPKASPLRLICLRAPEPYPIGIFGFCRIGCPRQDMMAEDARDPCSILRAPFTSEGFHPSKLACEGMPARPSNGFSVPDGVEPASRFESRQPLELVAFCRSATRTVLVQTRAADVRLLRGVNPQR